MERKKDLIVSNAWICQVIGTEIIPQFGDMIIHDGKITEIQEKNFPDYKFTSYHVSSNEINAGGRVATLPMINFHDHFYSRLAKGLPLKGPMDNFKNILETLWWKLDMLLDADMIKASAQMAALESIRNGVTYIFDHHSSPKSASGSLNTIAAMLKEIGLRGVLCFETTDRNGNGLSKTGLNENREFILNHTNDDIKAMLGLHASFTLNDITLNNASELMREFNTGIHVHLCEDKVDGELTFAAYNSSPVERLKKFELLNEKNILAHGIYLSDEDYMLISRHGGSFAYNPDSNMNNAVGLPNYSKVSSAIPILCGTDGMNSNPARTLKQLFLLSRHQGMSFTESFEWSKKIYFDQISFVKKYFNDFPSLGAGDRADFIVWDYIPPTPLHKNNFWGHFIYGILERTVMSVISNGNVLMNDFKITFDESNYNKNIVEQGTRLYHKMNEINS